jgi:hypothetical protein
MIATNDPSIGAALAALISGGSNASAAALAASKATFSSPASPTNFGINPATNVSLSDQTKAVLARAKSDQVAAAQLRAFVEAHRLSSNGGADSAGNKSAETPSLGNFTGQDGTIYGVIVTPTEPGSAVATAVPTVDPKVSFSSQLEAGGFTISATGDASTGTYDIEIDGPNGFHWSDQKLNLAPGLGFVSGAAPADGQIMSGAGPGNIETINFFESGATAESLTASSDAGSLSVTEASVRALSATVSIDFSTGTIQIYGSSATASSQSVRLDLSA